MDLRCFKNLLLNHFAQPGIGRHAASQNKLLRLKLPDRRHRFLQQRLQSGFLEGKSQILIADGYSFFPLTLNPLKEKSSSFSVRGLGSV